MSQKSTKFDEFASLFRSVVRPHLEVEPLPLKRLLVAVDVCSQEEKFDGVCSVVESMQDRFHPEIKLFAPVRSQLGLEKAKSRIETLKGKLQSKDCVVQSEVRECFPGQSILAEVESFAADFLVLPSLFGEDDPSLEGCTLGAVVDKVLASSRIPILLIEGEVPQADLLWTDMLLFVEDAETAGPCLAATRTLAAKEADARMLHVIDARMLAIVERAFRVATELETEKAEHALTAALRKEMDHFLQGAKDLLDRTGHRSSFEILVGDPVEVARNFIREKTPHLVICNSVAPDQRLVDSVAYNLAAYLREVPLLLV